MLKISETRGNGTVTLRAEGRAIGPWVSELRKSVDSVLADGHALKLDLHEVEYADTNALRLLVELARRGVIVACSPFLSQQLKTTGSSQAF